MLLTSRDGGSRDEGLTQDNLKRAQARGLKSREFAYVAGLRLLKISGGRGAISQHDPQGVKTSILLIHNFYFLTFLRLRSQPDRPRIP